MKLVTAKQQNTGMHHHCLTHFKIEVNFNNKTNKLSLYDKSVTINLHI